MKKTILFIFFVITNLIFSQDTLIDSAQIKNDPIFSQSDLEMEFKNTIDPYNPLLPPNTYTNTDNPNYWKNKMPHPGYWQQDVHYSIKAELFDSTNVIEGTQTLTYTNNSPDDLDHVFFHLYANAFQPDSYLDKFKKANKELTRYRKDEKQKKGINIISLEINNETPRIEVDNTIMKVFLNTPIKSGETVVFDIIFESSFGGNEESGNVRRRMKMYQEFGSKHYNGVHWYPRISVYDRKFGWTTDQHLGKEFYGDFGCFDVELTMPENYILEATGYMINRDEVLPKELMKKLDITNFKSKKYNSPPSTIIRYNPNKKKTWKFHAENVHDFAFTADPSYRIGVAEWNGIKAYSLAQEQHASKWQNAADYAAEIIEVFSKDIGMYTYHKIIVADARSGMEYPMITLDSGRDPGYRGLLVHEIAHMWFFGQVGTNETYRAALDEGFTQFLSGWGEEAIEGKYMTREPKYITDSLLDNKIDARKKELSTKNYSIKNSDNASSEKNTQPRVGVLDRLRWLKQNQSPLNKYYDQHTNQRNTREGNAYYKYILDATENNTPALNSHSHDTYAFGEDLAHRGGYTHVYWKTATMLYNLQYVLGDELFLAAMQNYFDTWKMAHPYLNDFRNSFIRFTKVDLNWFFDQWLETNKDLDYAIGKVKKLENDTFEISVLRKGEMEMPIDLTIDSEFGLRKHYHIPNKWFVKEDKNRDYLLPRWTGYGELNREYKFKAHVPSGIKNIMIDLSERLADSYAINNNQKGNIDFSIDYGVKKWPNLRKYEVQARPDFWYNSYDGLKIGTNLQGNYLKKHHVFRGNLWVNSGVLRNNSINDNENDKLSYRLNYSTSTYKYVKNSRVRFALSALDGLNYLSVGFNLKDVSRMNTLDISFNSFERKETSDITGYLLNQEYWGGAGMKNTNILINTGHHYRYIQGNKFSGSGDIQLSLKSSSIMSDYNFSQISLSAINKNRVGKIKINTRFFAQRGFNHTGSEYSFPFESMLYAAGGNPEEMMSNKYTRSAGFIPYDWASYSTNMTNTLHYGGGLNLRGYVGYKMGESASDLINENEDFNFLYRGTSGIAFNTEIDFTNHIPYMNYFGLNSYIFMDMGVINQNNHDLSFSSLHMDAGIGFALELSKLWNSVIDAEPLVLRFDLPFFLNKPPADQNYIDFRFVFGINRAF
ncbi:MAG: aminopeptidase [Flavobacteriales bacterium]|nr:aminopeptidase [Flavobacteriales bacterium]